MTIAGASLSAAAVSQATAGKGVQQAVAIHAVKSAQELQAQTVGQLLSGMGAAEPHKGTNVDVIA